MTSPVQAPAASAALRVLEYFATTYSGARKAAGELRTKLAAIEHERKTWVEAAESGNLIGPPDRELAEIERVHRTLARSASVSTDRLKALEAVIAAITRDLVSTGAVPVREEVSSRPELRRPSATDPSVRGVWTAPDARSDGRA